MNVPLDPTRQRSAMERARSEIASARLSDRASRNAREKAATLARTWGFVVERDEVGPRCGSIAFPGVERCERIEGHTRSHLHASTDPRNPIYW